MHVWRIPKVSILMALTTKIGTEKVKKWPKMARVRPKSRYNGRVMAQEVSFYQCNYVTKFWAKFGCSRTPRTARALNSFIVLRCMWKEPAPLNILWVLKYFCLDNRLTSTRTQDNLSAGNDAMLLLLYGWMAAMMMTDNNHLVISDKGAILKVWEVWILANLFFGKRFDIRVLVTSTDK